MTIWDIAGAGLGLVAVALLHEHVRNLIDHVFGLLLQLLAVISGRLQELREFLRRHLQHTAQTAGHTGSLVVKSIMAVLAAACVVVLAGVDIQVTAQTTEALGFGFLGRPIAIGLIVAILGIGTCLMETHQIHSFGLFAGASEAGRKLVNKAASAFLLLALAAQIAMGAWRAGALAGGDALTSRYLAALLVNVGLPVLLTGVALLLGWALPWLVITLALVCLGLALLLVAVLVTVVTVLAGLIEHARRILLALIDLLSHLGARIWPRSAGGGTAQAQPAPPLTPGPLPGQAQAQPEESAESPESPGTAGSAEDSAPGNEEMSAQWSPYASERRM